MTSLRRSYSTELTLTDPLQIYENKLARGELFRDEAQHRAAVELQKLSYRLIDYEPPVNFKQRIRQLSDVLEQHELKQQQEAELHPEIERKAWYVPDEESTELIKQLSDEEELLNFNSPQGLLLYGEVGCGKSMLMDLFADSLPHVSKQRIHYNNFMLSLYGHIHQISEKRRQQGTSGSKLRLENDFILLQLAEKMIDRSTVLLLDEFMLPDIAAAKIVQTLFVFFFKLGGVLVATSNRLPEELYSTDFRKAQFQTFFRILQARCVSHDMRSENDWRAILSDPAKHEELLIKKQEARDELGLESKPNDTEFPDIDYYHVLNGDKSAEDNWAYAIQEIAENYQTPNPAHVLVYGHRVNIPWQNKGVAYFDFEDICGTYLAAADYISLASRYHTFIIDNVPALKIHQKNEARRFITLLDALYESKCRLLIRAQAAPEDLFFADVRDKIDQEEEEASSLEQEMISEVHQDLSQPFRPNVASYENNDRAEEPKKPKREINNNDESTFSSASPMEDDPSKKFFPANIPEPNFTKVSAFTGEDERFAYKRAVSRLKEMTGSKRWVEDAHWKPLDPEARPWESFEEGVPLSDDYYLGVSSKGSSASSSAEPSRSTGLADHLLADESKYTSPFRKLRDAPPKFDAKHFWALVEWGPGAKIKDQHAREWIQSNNGYTQEKKD